MSSSSSLATTYRTHTCGELRITDVGKTVTLSGWVQKSRDKKAVFIDIRDRHGIIQVLVDNDESDKDQAALYQLAQSLGRETVLQVTGVVVERQNATVVDKESGKTVERVNKNTARLTGDIEVRVDAKKGGKLTVLADSKPPKMKIEDATDAAEDTCLQFRFLDLRRPIMQQRLLLRQQVTNAVRTTLCGHGFCEIETPLLIKSTPEGARDFVVPTRRAGQFYALPQSPQTFKQLLMVSGMDRYFQIARCFRDEELRSDRQPEFTQIDCEMSFVSRNDVLTIFEGMIKSVFAGCGKQLNGGSADAAFPRMDYKTAMEKYGIDKPDTRYEMFLTDLTTLVCGQMEAKKDAPHEKMTPFLNAAGPTAEPGTSTKDKLILALAIPGGAKKWSSGKKLKELEKRAKTEVGAPFMVWVKIDSLGKEDGSGIKLTASVKLDKPDKPGHFSDKEVREWCVTAGAKDGDVLCVFAGPGARRGDATRDIVGKWRHVMGTEMGFRPLDTFSAHWVVDFPLLEWSDGGDTPDDPGRWCAKHHPFTSCVEKDAKLLMEEGAKGPSVDPEQLCADAYDLVINGVEVGGGSIRINQRRMQEIMFELLGFTPELAKEQFGFLMDAFEYGAPPHGGMAIGLDRLVAILAGTPDNIRMVMAFPKNSAGKDMMIDAPAPLAPEQLKELNLELAGVDGGGKPPASN